EIGTCDLRIETVLLEEKRLQSLGTGDPGFRRKRGATGYVPENRIGLWKMTSSRNLQQRHLPVGIFREKLRSAALALEDVDFEKPVGNAEPREREANLVAVARSLHRVERVHSEPDRRCPGRKSLGDRKSGNYKAYDHAEITKMLNRIRCIAAANVQPPAAVNRRILFRGECRTN